MKHRQRAILSVALAIACMAGVSAQSKPNFAGKWKTAGSFNTWTITVEGNKMTVTMTVAGNSDSQVYMLDGTPVTTKAEGPAGVSEIVYTSTWEGDVLATTIAAPQMIRIERRSIEPDGTMKVNSTITMMQGKPVPPGSPSPPPMVFTKVGAKPAPAAPPPPLPPLPAKEIIATVPAAVLDRYVGEYQAASGFTAIFRREGTTLFVKPGPNSETALIPRSETRFQDPRGPYFDFQFDAEGKVTSAVLEQEGPQGTQKVPLQRK